MSCGNVISRYTKWHKEQEAKGFTAEEINSIWMQALMNKRSGARKQALETILDANPSGNSEIAVMYNGGRSKPAWIVDIIEEGNRWRLFTNHGSYLFDKGNATSLPTTTKGNVKYAAVPVMETLGAQLDDLEDRAGEYRQLEAELLKNPEKAIELFDNILEMDNIEISDEYRQHLKDTLQSFTEGNYIPNVIVHLNEKADVNGGTITTNVDKAEADIKLAVGRKYRSAANEQSAVEKYVHEVAHAITEFSLQMNTPEAADAKRRLEHLREQVRLSVPKDKMISMLMPKNSIDKVEEQKIAESVYEYIFENTDSGISEFIAYSTTNEQFMDVLGNVKVYTKKEQKHKNLFEAVVDYVRRIINFATMRIRNEDTSMMADQLAMKLVMELGRANNKLVTKRSPFEVIGKVMDKLEAPIVEQMEKYAENLEKKELPKKPVGGTRLENAVWFAKVLQHMVYDERGRQIAEKVFSSLGMAPEGLVQSFVNKTRDSDTLDAIVEQLGLASQQIDQKRETIGNVVEMNIVGAFKKKPTDTQMNTMTVVGLDTDMSSIYDEYSREGLNELLQSDKKLQEEINKKRTELKDMVDGSTGNYYTAQANGLGFYLATHKGNVTQLLNAKNIAQGLNRTEKNFDVSEDIVTAIDELATLEALKYTETKQKKDFAEMMKDEPTAVDNFIGVHKTFKEESSKKLFDQNEHLQIKGYTKEIFNEDITTEVAPLKEQGRMRNEGFELVEILDKAQGDRSVQQMGLYVSKDYLTQSYNRDAIRMTDWNRRGTTLTEARTIGGEELARQQAEVDVLRINKERDRLVKLQEQGKFKVMEEKGDGLVPVVNEYGKVIDYRYMMSKGKKLAVLEQDIRGPKVLGRMMGSITDKVETKDHNKKVVEAIKVDMDENFVKGRKLGKKNLREYIVIEEFSPNKEIRDIWRILPKDMKQEFKEMGTVAVRRDMMYSYFGFRDMSIADSLLIRNLPPYMKHVVRVAEEMWKELVKISKVDIVIRTPGVLIGNIISNFMYSVQNGENPAAVAKLQLKAVRDLREYIDGHRELIELQVAKASGNVKNLDLGKIPSLEENIKNNPVRDLIDAGMYQAIIEDIGLNDFKTSNKWTKKLNKKIEGAPTIIQQGLNWMYFTEQTEVFKIMTTATQFSDFAARYAQYHLLLKKGVKKKDAQKQVLDAFVNYNGSDKTSKYLNDVGMVMFTKYFSRIQRVIRQQGTKHPLYVLASLLGQNFVTGDIDDITDQSMFIKDMGVMFYNPFDHVMRAVMPTAFEWADDAYEIATR